MHGSSVLGEEEGNLFCKLTYGEIKAKTNWYQSWILIRTGAWILIRSYWGMDPDQVILGVWILDQDWGMEDWDMDPAV
jgi:hypothetical protein